MALQETVLKGVALAEKAIQNLKIPGRLTRRVPTAHVPGQAPAPSISSTPINVVITSFKTFEIDGDRIRASDVQGLVFPADTQKVPEADDILEVFAKDGVTVTQTYRVIYNDKVYAGDLVALSQLQLRIK